MAKRHHHRVHEGAYAGYEARKMQEHKDGGMLNEDRSKIANMPQEVMIKAYAPCDYAHYGLEDTIKGIDHQKKEDGKHQKKGEYPEMY